MTLKQNHKKNRTKLKACSLLMALGLTLAGCGGSGDDFVFTGQNGGNQVLQPVARPDAYSTGFQTALAVPANTGVLANDTPNAIPGQTVTVTFQSTSLNGGTLSLTDDGGAFTYTPPTGFVGTDTFGYELSNGAGVSRTTVEVEVTLNGPGVFVDSRTGSDSTGDPDTGAPFATVQAAITAAGPGGDIVVLPGSGTYPGPINLLDGQRLLGIESTLVNAQGVVRPTFTGPIVLADGNTVDSISVVRTEGIAIDGDGQTDGTITNCSVSNNIDDTGIQVRDLAGTWVIEDNTVTAAGGIGIDLDTQDSSTGLVYVNRNTITNSHLFGLGLAAFGSSEITIQANDNVLTGNGFNLGPNNSPLGLLCGAAGTATLNLQIIGNENDGIYGFAAASTLNVENFGDFANLNEGEAVVLQGTVNDVPSIPGL
jgi:hypothetical protein